MDGADRDSARPAPSAARGCPRRQEASVLQPQEPEVNLGLRTPPTSAERASVDLCRRNGRRCRRPPRRRGRSRGAPGARVPALGLRADRGSTAAARRSVSTRSRPSSGVRLARYVVIARPSSAEVTGSRRVLLPLDGAPGHDAGQGVEQVPRSALAREDVGAGRQDDREGRPGRRADATGGAVDPPALHRRRGSRCRACSGSRSRS